MILQKSSGEHFALGVINELFINELFMQQSNASGELFARGAINELFMQQSNASIL